jgi:DNA-binding transcriptional LysR family regulator
MRGSRAIGPNGTPTEIAGAAHPAHRGEGREHGQGRGQPNVSKAIADLEQAFGARLLDRGARGVEPTNYGLAIIKRGVAVFDELRHAVDDVAFLADPTSGELRLGCSDWTAGVVGAAIGQISRRYPRIVFDVLTTDAAALQHELKGRTIELFVAARLDSPTSEDFDADILYDDPFVMVADAHHPLVGRRSIKLAELIKEAWVLPPANTIAGSYIRDAFRKNGLPLPTTIVRSYSAVLQLYPVATSRFIMVLPKSIWSFPNQCCISWQSATHSRSYPLRNLRCSGDWQSSF